MPRQRLLVVEANFFSLPPSFCSYLTIFKFFFLSKLKKHCHYIGKSTTPQLKVDHTVHADQRDHVWHATLVTAARAAAGHSAHAHRPYL